MRENCICIDAHDLGVVLGKLGEVRLNCRQLVLSNRGEVKGVEQYDDILTLLAGKLKVTLRLSSRTTQFEIECRISYS